MTVYRPKGRREYVYDFRFKGKRYVKSTVQIRLRDAQQVEDAAKLTLRRRAAGLAVDTEVPTFTEWAEAYFAYVRAPTNPRRLTRPAQVRDLIRVVLRFWGHPPNPGSRVSRVDGEPYHGLRLSDPIDDPEWIVQFEDWMLARVVGPQTRNHYRSIMSRMYRVAMLPRFRKGTGVTFNPFTGIERDRVYRRTVTVTADQLSDWIDAASPHVRLALAIGALGLRSKQSCQLLMSLVDSSRAERHRSGSHPRCQVRRRRPDAGRTESPGMGGDRVAGHRLRRRCAGVGGDGLGTRHHSEGAPGVGARGTRHGPGASPVCGAPKPADPAGAARRTGGPGRSADARGPDVAPALDV